MWLPNSLTLKRHRPQVACYQGGSRLNYLLITVTGLILGVLSAVLVHFGNPGNMGYCIACFLRDISGALGLQRVAAVQYLRPEIIGLVLGAFASSLVSKEFRPRGGSSPVVRFVLGMAFMVGALIFLGCPVRLFLRLAGGDWSAIAGLAGLIAGIAAGFMLIRRGFTLGRAAGTGAVAGSVMPASMVGLLILLVTAPAFIFHSTSGPGSMAAPLLLSLGAGLAVGILAQRSRFCTIGGIRDLLFIRDTYLIRGALGLLIGAFVANLAFGAFKPAAVGPIAHGDWVWNFIGMVVAGMAAVLLGGCPLRQLIMSGEGNTDSAITVFGMVFGAAVAHNFGLASSAQGPTVAGMWAGGIALLVTLLIGWFGAAPAGATSASVGTGRGISAGGE